MSASKKPNIIFIMADDMGYGDVGCYNTQSKIPTPNMDRLAHEGMVHHSGNGVFSLRQAEWKCIFETSGSGGWPPPVGSAPVPGTPGQLYNLFDDPGEQQNLWDIRPRVVAELTERLETYKRTGRSAPKKRS